MSDDEWGRKVNDAASNFRRYRQDLERIYGPHEALLRICSAMRGGAGTEPYVVDAGLFRLIDRVLDGSNRTEPTE